MSITIWFWFRLWTNECALYQYSTSSILNIVSIVTVFSKNSDSEKEQL